MLTSRGWAAAAVADVVRQDATDRQRVLQRAPGVDGAGDLPVGVRQAAGGVQEAPAHRLVPRLPASLLRRQQAPSHTDHARSGSSSSPIVLPRDAYATGLPW